MKRSALTLSLLAIATACSQQPPNQTDSAVREEISESSGASIAADSSASAERADLTPNIGTDVAPGVAFDYRFDFSLIEARIADTQERHAALCGKLGVRHCRVTSLKFNKQRGGQIDAMLAFKVDPALAMRFGRDAAEIVTDAEGRLESSLVGGEDAGSEIVINDKTRDGLESELAKIEAQLKITGLSGKVRIDLNRQAADLRGQLRALGQERDTKVESLATTPVLFNYEVSDAVLGFDRSSPAHKGFASAKASLAAMFAFLAILVGGAGPWLLLGAGVWWVVRRMRAKPVVSAE